MPTAIPGPAANQQQLIGGIEDPVALLLGQGPLNLQLIADRQHFDLFHRLAEWERTMLMNPLGKGLEMGGQPIDGPVRPLAQAIFGEGVLQGGEKIAADPGRPGRAHGVAEFLLQKTQEQGQIALLLFL